MKELLLKLENAHVHYGGVQALNGASIEIDEGEVVALMGPNGAGKTTVIRALFGLTPLSSGSVKWHGQLLTPVPHEMARRGVAYVPQGRQVFKHLSVEENLELGGYALSKRAKDIKHAIDEVLRFFPALREKLSEKAGTLSGGQQQMLAIARALVADPRVLLLDEPSLGLAPKVVKEVFAKIREIRDARNLSVLIVEHSITSALGVAERAYVLSQGRVVHAGSSESMKKSDVLNKVFLAA